MQLSTTMAAALLASLTSATVFQGVRTGTDGSKSQVAYTNGTPDICSGFTTIRQGDGNPCGINFCVDGNNCGFNLQGCGGNNFHLERNGAFNSICRFEPKRIACSGGVVIQQNWNCS
ncbi:hypothetical protein BJ875DRAFT_474650 [Amylocarpus encephaloides]|uniref:Uncharacterized protein n=1 Tax=Amylocarpus encephaloides TaxID=45428 RepID=A0A9P7YAH9_9HELO|nr:hypothetical protein BJ875DRAFT_474650 [Amylocarpus encephaloides]